MGSAGNRSSGATMLRELSIFFFAFVYRQVWDLTLRISFPPGKNVRVGLDAVIGQGGSAAARTAAGLLSNSFATTLSIPEFVKAQGGEYFLLPSVNLFSCCRLVVH